MRPSRAVKNNIDQLRAVLARHPVKNARLFGSASRGDDIDGSDLDILVEPTETTTLLDLARLKLELERLLGIGVDIATPRALPSDLAENLANDLKPL
ncbi:MAG: nucleotidyltransferase domain-containing protein [Xanthobacteraceae bacterium]|nr:nucleotidyltransferase domain-containing protein [Xanthobacteraceae bacterium]